MEHFFRTALWILVLIGCLQAVPVPLKKDFHFEFLQSTCHGNKTFVSPKNVSNSCLAPAVETISHALKHALNDCHCEYCEDALEALERVKAHSIVIQSNSTECTRKQEGPLTFGAFVKEFEDVIERITNLAKH